ncbi:glucosamine-6-phosphate deaminase [Limimaricola sp.]|uniref:glucosamine-6-phosphate deaminase n=1 Tax=Limimaricola sp. TaxID=2211665 RepID=UPI004058BED1
MEPVYARLVEAVRAGTVRLDRMTSFNLDEYVGLPPDHAQSYHAFMRAQLIAPLGLDPARLHLPRGDAPDPVAEARRYEAAILAAGGIDLQLLGIGENGHIGFNEPSSSLASPTRVKTLNRGTRAANARFFGPGETVPRHAITMGIATILQARHALMLATGAHKAAAVAAMAEGPVSARCPASALQMHPRATIVLDAAAAAKLELRDYYDTVHPDGREPPLG